MNKLVSAAQMRALESAAFRRGISGDILMEEAAYAAAGEINRDFPKSQTVTVVCGKGNNGGDGLALARILHCMEFPVKICLVSDTLKTDSARRNFELAKSFGIEFTDEITSDIVIDAIFGIGIKGGADEPYIDKINESGAFIISLDIPSGVCADTGTVSGKAVKANLTLTFGYKKTGLTQYPGKSLAGEIRILPISVSGGSFNTFEIDKINGMLPESKPDDNKGSRGKVLIIAGCAKYLGAAKMCTLSALRSGCGLVSLMLPGNLCNAVYSCINEAVLLPLECTDYITFNAFISHEKEIMSADSIVIGPGLSASEEVLKILDYLSDKNKPVIIDADGINSICRNIDILKKYKNAAITPHPGEFSRLFGVPVPSVQSDRIEAARNASLKTGAVVVLKGASTVTASPDGTCYINTTGNPGMATGGSGDTLAGIAGAVAARTKNLTEAMYLSVYLHGLAGDTVCEKMGSEGMLPTDLINILPYAIQKTKI